MPPPRAFRWVLRRARRGMKAAIPAIRAAQFHMIREYAMNRLIGHIRALLGVDSPACRRSIIPLIFIGHKDRSARRDGIEMP